MPVVISKESGLAENLPDQLAQAALTKGTHEFPLNDPEGNPASAAYADVPELLAQGYSIPSTEHLQEALKLSAHATPTETAKALGEAAASSATFGLSAAAEKMLGVKPKEMLARREALETLHPVAKAGAEVAGLAGSSMLGVGEGAALAKLGKVVPELGTGFAAQVGTAAARAGLENAAFQAGDEATKMFIQDPTQSAETAMSNIGLAGVLGAGVGGALGTVPAGWDALMEGKASKFIADAKARTLERLNNPDPAGALTNELGSLHKNIIDMNREVYGKTGLKAQDIERLMPEMNTAMREEPIKIQSRIQDSIDKMVDQPFKYGGERYPGLLNEALTEFKAATQDVKNPVELFNALNELKQNVNKYIPRHITPDNPSFDAVQEFKNIGKELRTSLENSKVWGKSGERQAAINKAFSEFKMPLKDFEKRFTVEIEGQRVIDPGKVNTYLNQLGKPNAEIKQEVLSNFLNSAEKYRNEIEKTHANLGIENPYGPVSTVAAHATTQEVPLGAQFADAIINKGIGDTVGASLGAAVGSAVGHPYLGAMFGKYAIGPAANKIMPSLLKAALNGPESGAGFRAALQYGTNVIKGESKLTRAAKAVFQAGKIEAIKSSHSDIKELKARVNDYAANPQLMLESNRKIAHYLPEHEVAISTTAARAVQYLATLRPDVHKAAPLDPMPEVNSFQEATYNQALQIAQDPTHVLQSVKEGSLTYMEMQHLQNLYPGLLQQMRSKVVEQMIEHKANGGMLPYKTQLSLSLLMGQPMTGTLSQLALQANQMALHAPGPQPQPDMRPKHAMSRISKLPQSYSTPQQAREAKRTQV